VTSAERRAIAQRLEKLTARGGGTLTAAAVVEDARNSTSPLHARIFGLSDAEAAHEHRLDLARQLIRSVRVTVTVDQRPLSVVAYVHASGGSSSYVPTAHVVDVRTRGVETLRVEFERVKAAIERARDLADALGLRAEFGEMLADVKALLVPLRRVA